MTFTGVILHALRKIHLQLHTETVHSEAATGTDVHRKVIWVRQSYWTEM